MLHDARRRALFCGDALKFEWSEEGRLIGLSCHKAFHKHIPLSPGEIRRYGEVLGALDFTLGYPPRETRWNWACLVGSTSDGRRFGLNAVAHFNQGLENAMWLDGALVPLGETRFRPGHERCRDTWQIETADGSLQIAFEPEGARTETIRLGLLASRFVQPFGRFTGRLQHRGSAVEIRGHGVVEDHFARW